jgi:HAD superfamily hydrolase (TIGR01549 family)
VQPFLIFDAYGTLAELDDFYGRLQRGFAMRGVNLPLDIVTRAAHREMRHYIKHAVCARDEASWLQLRNECAQIIGDAVREQGHEVPLEPQQVLDVLSEAIVFQTFAETRSVLQELQTRGVPMGVLSNWDYQLPQIFDDLGLSEYFHFVLSSATFGEEKPSPRFFAHGLQEARRTVPQLTARDCFYIGDHYEKDVVPSRAAGMTPLWLVRDSRDLASGETHSASEHVVHLSTLHDILRVLDEQTLDDLPDAASSRA